MVTFPTPKNPRTLGRVITALFPVAAVLLTVFVYLLSFLVPLYFYTDERPTHTLGDTLSDRLSAMEQKVTVRFCMAEEDLEKNAALALVFGTVRQTAERYPDKVELLSPLNVYLDHAEVSALAEKTSSPITRTSVIVESSVATRVLDADVDFWFLDTNSLKTGYVGEEIFLSTLLWVQTPSDEHPAAYFTTGHGENLLLTGLTLPLALAGYRLEPLALAEESVPNDAACVVISNPLYDFEKAAAVSLTVQAELDRLAAYVDHGGRVLFTADAAGTALSRLVNLRAFLADRGVTVGDGILTDTESAVSGGNILSCTVSDTAAGIGKAVADVTPAPVLLRDAAPITIESTGGYTARSLVSTAPTARNAEGVSGSYTVVAVTENSEGGKIAVHSGAYLFYDDVMQATGYANRTLLYAILRDFGASDAPLGATLLDLDNSTLQGLTSGASTRFLVVFAAVLPLAVLVTGGVILIRRKRR